MAKNKTMARPVPVETFGKDHWSTFAYIETRCVDHGGEPDRDHMRTDPKLNPGLAGRGSLTGEKHPTRLKDGGTLADHDDWSCAEDLEAAGLLEWKGTGMFPIFRLSDKGKAIAARLRAHKSAGGNFADFKAGTI